MSWNSLALHHLPERLNDFQPDEWIDAEMVLPDSDSGVVMCMSAT